ncbi:hypothetical protein [Bradyrhizobium betae]|uniref:Uncharacterized protein n=1 Tax=Bradyrhizobium betae TaxID=244734 RepID=A0A5P6NYP4_9BRAD|nr:hypothetical protein [Bradyrhizobium betae]MCS3725511.1 hypothetical protein [Bradyrhizobium betae]QFI71201.1 hypothetical protein F8237_01725 [Bradyrhizobium betae]
MYLNPVLLPQQTNREDLLRTICLFDDDTGEAIDVSGRVLAAPGDFTAAAWVVTSGAIVTASATQLTIKDYPIGAEMQAVACTVGIGLAIAAGAPVTIADAATGKNTMTGYVTSYAPATGAMVTQVGSAFEFEIRGRHHHEGYGGGYGPSSGIGTDACEAPLISAQLGSGLILIDLGRIEIRIPAATMAKLRHRTYDIAMAAYDGYDSRQLFIGKLPVFGGGTRLMPLQTPNPSNPYGLP